MSAPALVTYTPLDRTMLCVDCEQTYVVEPTILGGAKPCPACSSAQTVPLAKWLHRIPEEVTT